MKLTSALWKGPRKVTGWCFIIRTSEEVVCHEFNGVEKGRVHDHHQDWNLKMSFSIPDIPFKQVV